MPALAILPSMPAAISIRAAMSSSRMSTTTAISESGGAVGVHDVGQRVGGLDDHVELALERARRAP